MSRPSAASERGADFGERFLEVFMDVIAQGLERATRTKTRVSFLSDPFRPSRNKESSEARKAARVLPEPVGAAMSVCDSGLDRRPAELLRLGRSAEFALKPLRDDWMKLKMFHGGNTLKDTTFYVRSEKSPHHADNSWQQTMECVQSQYDPSHGKPKKLLGLGWTPFGLFKTHFSATGLHKSIYINSRSFGNSRASL